MSKREKKLDFRIGGNNFVVYDNGIIGGCVFGITLSVHESNKTWLVVAHFIFFEISLGWVDKE